MTMTATMHRTSALSSPATVIRTKPDSNNNEQQTRERIEMVFSITTLIEEMPVDFSEVKTMKQMEVDFSMATQEPVERV
jgi:hypothetical protein